MSISNCRLTPETATRQPDGSYGLVVTALEGEAYNKLGLIITRLDDRELDAPSGAYHVSLEVQDER
jgi:hypothetical protein